MTLSIDHLSLTNWFKKQKRALPWRESPLPYHVWVSEIMLQQTQVDVVIPYFYRWMNTFPTIEALANASRDQVIKAWEGLGYYSRARNLHKGARFIIQEHEGSLPSTEKELLKIPGIGPYTAGAILNFAFHKRAPAVDGNVMRVLSRYFCLSDDISQGKTLKKFQEITRTILPEKESWICSEALIELGALICKKQPLCSKCPLNGSCKALRQNMASTLPIKKKKIEYQNINRVACLIECNGKFLIRRAQKGEIMSDLHEFPYFEEKKESEIKKAIEETLHLSVLSKLSLPPVKHSFTRFRINLASILFETKTDLPLPGFSWVKYNRLHNLAFSSGHKKVLQHLQKIKK